MSEPGTDGPRRHRRRNQPARLRPLIAVAALLLVSTPIAWVLFRDDGGGLAADDSVPYVTLDDDRYISTKDHEEPIADSTRDLPETATTPSTSAEPTDSPTPSDSPSASKSPRPTNRPTDVPTGPVTVPATGRPTYGPTATGRPTESTTPTVTEPQPTDTTTPSPDGKPTAPTPDDGSMTAKELELFRLIDNERAGNGCDPLRRDSDLTATARADAQHRAEENELTGSGTSYVAAGGDSMTATAAFDRMISRNAATLTNCNLGTLGVGRGTDTYRSCTLLLFCSTETRVAWVADFD